MRHQMFKGSIAEAAARCRGQKVVCSSCDGNLQKILCCRKLTRWGKRTFGLSYPSKLLHVLTSIGGPKLRSLWTWKQKTHVSDECGESIENQFWLIQLVRRHRKQGFCPDLFEESEGSPVWWHMTATEPAEVVWASDQDASWIRQTGRMPWGQKQNMHTGIHILFFFFFSLWTPQDHTEQLEGYDWEAGCHDDTDHNMWWKRWMEDKHTVAHAVCNTIRIHAMLVIKSAFELVLENKNVNAIEQILLALC